MDYDTDIECVYTTAENNLVVTVQNDKSVVSCSQTLVVQVFC